MPNLASRRSLLKGGLAATTAGLLVPSGTARATTAHASLRALESRHDARLGVYGRNTATGATVAYRSDERFAICSVFKTLIAAQVLRDYDRDGEYLERLITYTEKDLEGAGFADVTRRHLHGGMTVRELCAATIQYSDNGAANLLMREMDGPRGITRFCRSIGDRHTRIDRYEDDMSGNLPGDVRDTTTPAAIGTTFAKLVLSDVLPVRDRTWLKSFMLGNTTSAKRFHAGLPDDWEIADKTGTSEYYGGTNDVGIAWTPKGTPLVLSVMTTKHAKNAENDDELVASAARILARDLT